MLLILEWTYYGVMGNSQQNITILSNCKYDNFFKEVNAQQHAGLYVKIHTFQISFSKASLPTFQCENILAPVSVLVVSRYSLSLRSQDTVLTRQNNSVDWQQLAVYAICIVPRNPGPSFDLIGEASFSKPLRVGTVLASE